MSENKEPVGGFMELIATLAAKSASGRLDIVAGTSSGALLFKNGKLVDARIGHLYGFPAINAVAAMRDARFHFDPSVTVPTFSPITPSERIVLKQFYGIETADANHHPMSLIDDEANEATLVTSTVPSTPAVTVTQPQSRSRTPYLIAFAICAVVIALTAAAVVLRNKFREQSSPTTVAARNEPVTRPVPAETSRPVAAETSRPVPAEATRPVPAETKINEKPIATAGDLTGKWNVVNTVDNTSYKSFQNLKIGFALSISQTGSTITATGQKVSENGRSLPASGRTPIQLKGSIAGDRIEATFFEAGATRKTNGRLVWKVDRARGELTGVFATTAARSSGKSTATREL